MSEQRKQIEAARDGALKKFLRSEFFFNYRHNISAMIGTVIVVLILLIAIFGPLFAPQDPYDVAGLSLIDPISHRHGLRAVTPGSFWVQTARGVIC